MFTTYSKPSSDKMAFENVSFKIFLKKNKDKAEIRRFNIKVCFLNNFEYLEAQIAKLFPKLNNKKFAVLWNDGEDEIKISSDEELILALSYMQRDLKKLFVEMNPQRKNLKLAFSAAAPGPNEKQAEKLPVIMPFNKADEFLETRTQIKEMLLKNMFLNTPFSEKSTILETSTSSSGEEQKISEAVTPPDVDLRKSSAGTPEDPNSEVCVDGEKLDRLSDLVYELAKITRSLSLRCPCESHQVEEKPNTPVTEGVVPKVMSLNESVVALRFVLDNVYLLKDKFFSKKKSNVCMQQDSYVPHVESFEMNPKNSQIPSEVKAKNWEIFCDASSSHDSGKGSESEAADIVLDFTEAPQDLDIVDCSSVKTISESSDEMEERWTLLNNDDMEMEQEKPHSEADDQADDLMEFESHTGQQSEARSSDAEGIYPRLAGLSIQPDTSAAPVQKAVESHDSPVSNLEMRAIFPHISEALNVLEQMGFDIKDSKILFLTELYEGNVEAVVELLLL